MTLREKMQALENEIEALRLENEQLRNQPPEVSTEEVDKLKKELEDSKSKEQFYHNRLSETIKRKSKIEKDLKNLRRAKIKFIYINPEGNYIVEYKDALDMIERLREELDILYKNNGTLEEENIRLKKEAQENEDIVTLYSSENSQLKEEIKGLKNTIQQLRAKTISQDITWNSYKDKTSKTPILVQGEEQDFYPGEQKDMILEYLHEKIKNLDPYTRQYVVVKSILEANPENGTRASMKQKLKEIFRDFKGFKLLTNTQNADLRDMGFSYTPCGSGHCKLILNGDERFMVTMAGTPSNPSRSLNQVSDITKVLL